MRIFVAGATCSRHADSASFAEADTRSLASLDRDKAKQIEAGGEHAMIADAIYKNALIRAVRNCSQDQVAHLLINCPPPGWVIRGLALG